MLRLIHFPATSQRLPRGISGAWWLAQWLLVLVLAFDHLSAPFHHHHHGHVAGQLGFAAVHASFAEGGSQAEGEEHPLVAHAAVAIGIDPARLGRLPPTDHPDAPVALAAVDRPGAVDAAPAVQWRPDRSRPDFRSHRSLPPAGRAPPLHA